MKTWKRILRLLFLVVVLVPVTAIIAIQIPSVQTAAVRKVAGILSSNIDGSVRVGKVYFSYPNSLIVKDIDVIQGADDTLAHIGKFLLRVKTTSLLFPKEARIRRIAIENSRIDIHPIDDSTTNLAALLAPIQKKDRPDTASAGLPWECIRVDQLQLKHIDAKAAGFDVKDLQFNLRDFRYCEPMRITARIENLRLEEAKGLQIKQLEADVLLNEEGLSVFGLNYADQASDLHAERIALGFSDFSDFSDFVHRVDLDVSLQSSLIDTRSVAGFLPLDGRQAAVRIWGQVRGPVSDLQSDGLVLQSVSGITQADLAFRITGLPDMEKARIRAEVYRLRTTTADLGKLIAGLVPGFRPATIARYAPGERLRLKARAEGALAHLLAHAALDTDHMGSARIDALLSKKADGLQAEGTVSTESLHLGRILGIPSLGELSSHTDLAFSSGRDGLSVTAEPLEIQQFRFLDYPYGGITASGSFRNGAILADLTSLDPNLTMTVHAEADLGGKDTDKRYRIGLNLDHLDMDAVHFDKRDGTALRMALDADITQTPQGAFLGNADIRGLQATLADQTFEVGDISVLSTEDYGQYNLSLISSLAKIDYDGNVFLTDFLSQSVHMILEDNLEHLFGNGHSKEEDEAHPEDFGSLHLRTLDLSPLLDFLAPNLYISRESSINLGLFNDDISGNIASELVVVGNLFFRNLQGRFGTQGERMMADIDLDRFQTGGLIADNVQLDAVADSTVVDVRAGFRNQDEQGNRASLHAVVSFPPAAEDDENAYPMRIDLRPSEVLLAGNLWELSPATFRYREKNIRIDDFAIRCGEQSLLADGTVSESVSDTVRIHLNVFDLGIANAFLSMPLDLQGLLTGRGEAFALLGPEKGILLDLNGRRISMAGIDMGNLRLLSRWDDAKQRFNFLIDNTLNGRHPINATATLHPGDRQFGLDMQLDSLKLGILEPMLSGLAGNIDGSVSGRITAEGPFDRLALNSTGARINDLKFKLLYTQVDYRADGPFSVRSDGITFDNIKLYDSHGHQGVLSGGVPFDHFKDLRLDARISLDNMMALNTTVHDNETFYGSAFADGTVRITGPLNKIRLNLNVTTKDNTAIHIPLGNSTKESKSLLTFINNEEKLDLYDSLLLAKQQVREKKGGGGNDLSVNLRVNATPSAEVQLEIDKKTGDILKARGDGQIAITVASGNFDIKGDYKIDSGNYHFGMLGFTSRDFSIDPGGTIAFGGDVMQSTLNLTATYRTKASISPLIADSTAVSTRRTVDCGIGISGRLANPEINFDITVPDLDPTTQSRVESALNTEDKRMKQALALLVSGGFVPDEQSGIVNSTTMFYSNASEMMASQLNNIFRQLEIPIDLGFNYQPNESGRDIFDVAVSTQLFNNRVQINGNIGNRHYISSSNSDIVGDLDIEIKLNRQGQLRMTVFSHSADQYSNYLDQSQRNGAGIVYQEDFNSFKELWKKILHIKPDERQPVPDSDPPRRPRTE